MTLVMRDSGDRAEYRLLQRMPQGAPLWLSFFPEHVVTAEAEDRFIELAVTTWPVIGWEVFEPRDGHGEQENIWIPMTTNGPVYAGAGPHFYAETRLDAENDAYGRALRLRDHLRDQ